METFSLLGLEPVSGGPGTLCGAEFTCGVPAGVEGLEGNSCREGLSLLSLPCHHLLQPSILGQWTQEEETAGWLQLSCPSLVPAWA